MALPDFHLDQLVELILNANPWWLLAAFGIYYLGFPIRGYRWALLLRGAGYPLRVRDSTEMIFISWLVNCLVPAKLGDVYRGYLLRINNGVVAQPDLRHHLHRARLRPLRDRGPGPGGRLLELPRRAVDGGPAHLRASASWSSCVLAVGLFVVRNFGRRILTRLPLPHRIVELYDQFEEGLFSLDPRQFAVAGHR